jgi:hypothetical protein
MPVRKRRRRQGRGRLHCGGQRFESPPLHQEVRASRHDFPHHGRAADLDEWMDPVRKFRLPWSARGIAERLMSLVTTDETPAETFT